MVFLLPHELNPIVLGHRKELFKLLFDAASHKLLTLGKDPKYLGAETGFTSILHTWGQDLSFHPYVHCIVSAGGVKDCRWVEEKRKNNKFVFPVGGDFHLPGFLLPAVPQLHLFEIPIYYG